MPWLLGRLALRRHLFVVEVAEGARRGVHLQLAVLAGADRDVVQGHDARKLAEVARERPHVMVIAHHADLDREFGIELLGGLTGRRPEQLELKAAAKARLVDVDEQGVHLGPVG